MDKRAETEAKVGLEEDEDAILAESAIAETGQRDSRRRTTVSFGQGERPKIDADGDVPSPLKAKKEDELVRGCFCRRTLLMTTSDLHVRRLRLCRKVDDERDERGHSREQ